MKNDLTKKEREIYTELLILKEYIKKEDFYNALLQSNIINNIDFSGCSYWLTSLFNDLSQKSINLGSKSKLPLSISGVVPDEKLTSNSTWSTNTEKLGFISTFVSARRNDGVIPCVDTSFFSCAGYLALELRRDSTYVEYIINLRGKYIIFKSYVSLREYLREYFRNTISESLFLRIIAPKVWYAAPFKRIFYLQFKN